jgi:hypothetical protein
MKEKSKPKPDEIEELSDTWERIAPRPSWLQLMNTVPLSCSAPIQRGSMPPGLRPGSPFLAVPDGAEGLYEGCRAGWMTSPGTGRQ